MAGTTETVDQSRVLRPGGGVGPTPGLLLVFSAGEPLQGALPLTDGALEVGRDTLSNVRLADARMSRRHAAVRFDGRRWQVSDLDSRNGSAVDGRPVTGTVAGEGMSVLRTGDTLFLLCPDLTPFLADRVEVAAHEIVGPTLRAAWRQIGEAARGGSLHLTGESGSGKELAAREFHRASARAGGPFVAVNCAAIPEGVAERLLFGTRKGAYSGALADAPGYVQEASGGTLFLDEVGDLDLLVQGKLLRVLESREVLPLGAARPVKVELQICSATHRDLRTQVAAKKFREDLYYRIGRPAVALPPLRARREEIPFFVDRELRRVDARLAAHALFVEACLLRPWPGNVRELVTEARAAAAAARAEGQSVVKLPHLEPSAGQPIDGSIEGAPVAPAAPPARAALEEALRAHGGRVATAARALGVHRTQLRRWLARHGIDPRAFAARAFAAGDDDPG